MLVRVHKRCFCQFFSSFCLQEGRKEGMEGGREGRGFHDLSRVLLVFAARREESGIEVGISKKEGKKEGKGRE